MYQSLNDPDFEIISVAQDSQFEAAADWIKKANPSFPCIVDTTHQISSLFGWVNVPSAAWIDEDGKIVRMNEGVYAGEHQIKNLILRVKFGNKAFGEATKDWVKNGVDCPFIQSVDEIKSGLKPVNDEVLLAEPTFKLGLYLQNLGKSEQAEVYFLEAQRLSPDNWNYHRQGWTFKGRGYAIKQWLKKTKPMHGTGQRYYDRLNLPGESEENVTKMEFFWTRIINKLKAMFA